MNCELSENSALLGLENSETSDAIMPLAVAYAATKRLSQREREVFIRFVTTGQSCKEIAAALGIGYPTVKLYWTRICRKLDCSTAVEALVAFTRDVCATLELQDQI